jgi:hypothetical protein
MPALYELDLNSDGVYEHGTKDPLSALSVFEGDTVALYNGLSDAVQVEIQVSGSASDALFGESSYSIPQGGSTSPALGVSASSSTPGASANQAYTLSYSTFSLPISVNTIDLSSGATDGPTSVTVCPNANVYFDTASDESTEKLSINSSALFGTTPLKLSNGITRFQVQATTGNYSLEDKGPRSTPSGPGGAQGDTITIKVDTSGAGTGTI